MSFARAAKRVRIAHVALMAWDCVAWLAAIFAYLGARYDFDVSGLQWRMAFTYGCLAAGLQLALGLTSKLYRGYYKIGSFEATLMLGTIVLGIGIVLGGYFSIFTHFSRGVCVTAPMGALIMMAWGHFVTRVLLEGHLPARSVATPAEPVLIYGAGNAGMQLGALIHNDPDSQGGFNWSSQHLDLEGVGDGQGSLVDEDQRCAGGVAATVASGQGVATLDVLSGQAAAVSGCPAGVLAGDRHGCHDGGGRDRGRRVGSRRVALVSSRWRHATDQSGRAEWTLPVLRRA